jgi:hypothetical protein
MLGLDSVLRKSEGRWQQTHATMAYVAIKSRSPYNVAGKLTGVAEM